MSVSTDSAAPNAPTVSSPMRAISSFVEWLSAISTWIRSLSPAGSGKYDTGWVDCTPNSGFMIQTRCQVRRIGKVVYMRGGFSNVGLAANSNFDIGALPAGFAGPTFLYVSTASQLAGEPGRGEVRTDGSIWLRTGDTVSPYYMYDGLTWTID